MGAYSPAEYKISLVLSSANVIGSPEAKEWVMRKIVEAAEHALAQVGNVDGIALGEWK